MFGVRFVYVSNIDALTHFPKFICFVLLIGYKCGDENWKGHLRIEVSREQRSVFKKKNWKVETDSNFYYH
jgi:hypothetical protein